MAVWCLSSEFWFCNMFVCLFSRSAQGLAAVNLVFLLTSVRNATEPILPHSDGTEKVSFFLVYGILITWVDLEVAKKSSDVVFQKERLVWIAVGQLWEKVKALRYVLVHTTNNTIPWCHWCIIAKHICSSKLWFIMTSLDPMVHCRYKIRPAFISYNAPQGINLPMEYNEVHFIIVNTIIYRMQH